MNERGESKGRVGTTVIEHLKMCTRVKSSWQAKLEVTGGRFA